MKREKEITKIFEEDGYSIMPKTVVPDKPLDTAALQDVERAQDYLNLIQNNEITAPLPAAPPSVEKVRDKKSELASIKQDEFDIPTIVGNLNWHMNRINENVIGRSEIIRQAIFAILTGEHMLLLSRTGMAKSYLAQYIFNSFEGARVFSSQASKDQTPDNYFGPYNIEEFKKGRIRHNIKGSIIEANMVFLDEFFDASDVVLRSLLTVLNERKFINGSEQIDTAVHTAIATANYMRMNEVTEAVLDRFTYKSIIPENTNVYNQLLIDHTYAMSGGTPVEPKQKIYFNQILYLYEIIKNRNKNIRIETPDFIYFMKNVLIDKFMSEMRKSDYNYFLSPRKIVKIGDFLRASALINNRLQVNTDDLKEMYLCLTTLNSYISVKAKDKSEVDLYLDTFSQTMAHYKASGANQQIELLLNIRQVFQEIRQNPERRDAILARKSVLQSLMDFLRKIFPTRRVEEDEKLTIESLKKNILDLTPVVEEVQELKNGILIDYRDL
ncbi:MAG: AAA family ATPase [Spirochaetes bacterium]|nr:AAA family ATPase [Spirochaetota bacterium]